MFFNILNYAIFNGKLSPIDKFSIRRIRDALAYYEYDEKTDIAQMTFKPKFSITKNITFTNHKKIANTLARAFKRFKPLKF